MPADKPLGAVAAVLLDADRGVDAETTGALPGEQVGGGGLVEDVLAAEGTTCRVQVVAKDAPLHRALTLLPVEWCDLGCFTRVGELQPEGYGIVTPPVTSPPSGSVRGRASPLQGPNTAGPGCLRRRLVRCPFGIPETGLFDLVRNEERCIIESIQAGSGGHRGPLGLEAPPRPPGSGSRGGPRPAPDTPPEGRGRSPPAAPDPFPP